MHEIMTITHRASECQVSFWRTPGGWALPMPCYYLVHWVLIWDASIFCLREITVMLQIVAFPVESLLQDFPTKHPSINSYWLQSWFIGRLCGFEGWHLAEGRDHIVCSEALTGKGPQMPTFKLRSCNLPPNTQKHWMSLQTIPTHINVRKQDHCNTSMWHG